MVLWSYAGKLYITEQELKSICVSQTRKFQSGKQYGGGKVHDNRGMGMARIILSLAVLIVFILVLSNKLVELAGFYIGSLRRFNKDIGKEIKYV